VSPLGNAAYTIIWLFLTGKLEVIDVNNEKFLKMLKLLINFKTL